jgi:hypothetical protein
MIKKGAVSLGIFEQVISMETRQGENQMTLTVRRAKVLFIQWVRIPPGS